VTWQPPSQPKITITLTAAFNKFCSDKKANDEVVKSSITFPVRSEE
jgi:hypothetical protein